jgi:hypothetical protein
MQERAVARERSTAACGSKEGAARRLIRHD